MSFLKAKFLKSEILLTNVTNHGLWWPYLRRFYSSLATERCKLVIKKPSAQKQQQLNEICLKKSHVHNICQLFLKECQPHESIAPHLHCWRSNVYQPYGTLGFCNRSMLKVKVLGLAAEKQIAVSEVELVSIRICELLVSIYLRLEEPTNNLAFQKHLANVVKWANVDQRNTAVGLKVINRLNMYNQSIRIRTHTNH